MTTRQATKRNQLAQLVRAWRLRLNPDEVPGVSAAYSHAARRRHASMELVATLSGCSVGWYSTLERGEPQNYSDDFLNRVAHTLRLSPTEKDLLFLLAAGHALTAPVHEPRMRRTPTLQQVLDAQPWPAFVCDEAWDLVAYNRHMSDWFPWVKGREKNVMRWACTSPEARRQLHRWETDWAPQMFAEMLYARARQPENMRLEAVINDILELNPDARRFLEQPLTYPHPDGDRRCLRLPYHRELQPIELVALAPLRAADSRLMMFIPIESNSD